MRQMNGSVVIYDVLAQVGETVGTSPTSLPDPGVAWSRVHRVILRTLGQPLEWAADGNDPDDTNSWRALADEIVVLDLDFEQFRMKRAVTATDDADVRIIYLGG